jgi:hypothetical protein
VICWCGCDPGEMMLQGVKCLIALSCTGSVDALLHPAGTRHVPAACCVSLGPSAVWTSGWPCCSLTAAIQHASIWPQRMNVHPTAIHLHAVQQLACQCRAMSMLYCALRRELTLRPPMLGSSQRLLNRQHSEAYFKGMPRCAATGRLLRRHGDEVQRLGNGYYCALGRCDDTMNLGGIKVRPASWLMTDRITGWLAAGAGLYDCMHSQLQACGRLHGVQTWPAQVCQA